MGEQKESIRVRKVSADKFLITRTMEEETDKAGLLKIHNDICKALETAQKSLDEIPVQVETRTTVLKKDVDILTRRKDAFDPFVEKIKEEEPPKEAAPSASGAG